ncbi:MAG: 3-phosphoshikimate 1-carboxyvinyltransferase [Ignavibacteriales bacterium]|nr:3-phosphoshikimate 1-carboxyvinyltransferase [Ignavibacteriales bacterium]
MSNEIRTIKTSEDVDAIIRIPPSKSYTNRALIAASLADGVSTIRNHSKSDDSLLLISALKDFGLSIIEYENHLEVTGTNGIFPAPSKEINVGNAGTAMRFLATFATLAAGKTVLTGDEQMNKRPINDLIDALKSNGVKCISNNGYPPIQIYGGNFSGGRINLDASISSQFLSSLLLSAPYAKRQVIIHINGYISSIPYIDMTLHTMRSFGAIVESIDMKTFTVSNQDRYIGHEFIIESDASSATYFLGAAAITKGKIIIENISAESLQGDIRFLKVLSEMGCAVTTHDDSIEIHGSELHGIDIDMNEMPDCVPTLAVVAGFAKGSTAIRNISHLRFKETDRIAALEKELTKIGVKTESSKDDLFIHPQKLHSAVINTYNDHRIAMSFAIAGLKLEGLKIENPGCVKKSFPTFWDEFIKLESKE